MIKSKIYRQEFLKVWKFYIFRNDIDNGEKLK